ncbi:hypothetical protein SAMN04487886_10647 [Clostridium sp. DSM 8431]|uniref:hypothetical protein n=1 Tax=Clostridium sp. DSM 8431 TaxID=1761781 RepID=UPI0008EAC224|nr:hypothetical protein [Clostridium sp. DSM 8431]SFU57925.1 hypothetical protein SAMN04487886_10647 [Clostridium sp. DSM 8431]
MRNLEEERLKELKNLEKILNLLENSDDESISETTGISLENVKSIRKNYREIEKVREDYLKKGL